MSTNEDVFAYGAFILLWVGLILAALHMLDGNFVVGSVALMGAICAFIARIILKWEDIVKDANRNSGKDL